MVMEGRVLFWYDGFEQTEGVVVVRGPQNSLDAVYIKEGEKILIKLDFTQ